MGSLREDDIRPEFEKTVENTIRVFKHRARYDYQTVYNILASTWVSNISFVVYDEDGEPSPFSLPMTAVAGRYEVGNILPDDDGDEDQYVRDQESFGNGPFDVYLHGNSAMLLGKMTRAKDSIKVVVSSTKVDGVVVHFAPNGHSVNYRSCVIHGDARAVTCPIEKRYAMHLLTNHMCRRRWSSTNEVAAQSMKSVQVIKVAVRSASAKIRAANINGLEKAGLGERSDVWTGVFPLYEVLGEPVPSGYTPERVQQQELVDWQMKRNEEEKEYAGRVAVPSKQEQENCTCKAESSRELRSSND